MSLNFQRIELQTVDSTNTYAKKMAEAGAAAGTLVFAHHQTAGRGRQGNVWDGFTGNLFATLILRPQVSAPHVGQLSFLFAVALADSLREILPPDADLGLKWPNDILLQGRKCAGILLESEGVEGADRSLPWLVGGFGVNLAAAPEGAISVTAAGGQSIKLADFLDIFEPHFARLYDIWNKDGFGPIQELWSKWAVNHGKRIGVRLVRETLTGVFEGIDRDGALQLRLDNGSLRHISSGEVYL